MMSTGPLSCTVCTTECCAVLDAAIRRWMAIKQGSFTCHTQHVAVDGRPSHDDGHRVLHSTIRCKHAAEDPRPFMIKRRFEIMEHDKTECQAPEAPILCVNNCGFFGSPATMNMCSKCHKDLLLKQEQAKLVASSVDSTVSGSGSSSGKEPVVSWSVDFAVGTTEPKTTLAYPSNASAISKGGETKVKDGPNRCNTCRKRVGLTGFTCRCGNLFCAMHRYSDEHNCPFDYRSAGRDAISKSNPVVKAEKLDKI